ncbi:lachrymatory-factor synthase [Pyrus ussuriensis x Pyrus communis]|uniref:Lachrymatory-factor synthase n=1 Tax=Pyrus ussuriensis x Pyrus communis TaxID=2448454 RepID=A0A5N5GXL2_9ROSA|nr:lachrymatory-factor synthase [Pyrus ussuriensis x Pyrus communis]
MGENQSPLKWKGKTSRELKSHAAQQVWPLLADFCNLHKWLPVLDACYLVDGVPGQPGVTRYCVAPLPYPDDGTIKWAKEKLLMIDPINHCLSYEIIENNFGFKSYVATMQLVPINGEDGKTGCIIEWSFVSDPVEGWKYEDLQAVYETYLELIAKNMENALLSSTSR